jgi:hypothetical protein
MIAVLRRLGASFTAATLLSLLALMSWQRFYYDYWWSCDEASLEVAGRGYSLAGFEFVTYDPSTSEFFPREDLTIESRCSPSNVDSPCECSVLDEYSTSAPDVPRLAASDLASFADLFRSASPRLAHEVRKNFVRDAGVGANGVLYVLERGDTTAFAWDLRTPVSDDHWLQESALVGSDGALIASEHYFMDIAGLEGVELLLAVAAFFVSFVLTFLIASLVAWTRTRGTGPLRSDET